MNWYGEEAYRAPQKTVRKRLAEGLMPLWRLLSLVVLVIYGAPYHRTGSGDTGDFAWPGICPQSVSAWQRDRAARLPV